MRIATIFAIVLSISSTVALGNEQSSEGAAPTEVVPAQVSVADEKPPLIETSIFAGRAPLVSPALSPDGKLLAMVRNSDGPAELLVYDAGSRELVTRMKSVVGSHVVWFEWAGPDKLLISISAFGKTQRSYGRVTRLFVANPITGEMAAIGRRNAVSDADNVIYIADDGSYALLAMQSNAYEYPSVYHLPLEPDGTLTQIIKPRERILQWIADDAGVVRMGLGLMNKNVRIFYRKDGDSKFKLLASIKPGDNEKYVEVAKIIAGSDNVYVLREGDSGRVGLHLYNYATQQIVETIYEHDQWDLESAYIYDGTPSSAYYTDDRQQVVWFDEEQGKLHRKLKRSLRMEDVWVISRSEDNSRMLISAGNESDPGALYIYTPEENRLELFSNWRPKVDHRHLAEVSAFSYTARDGTEIRTYLTLPKGRDPKGLPLIILPHGGPFGVRDSLVYNDEVQLLANRGYAVLQPNYRGSGGYGEDFFELGTGQIGRAMQDDLNDAMDWAVAKGFADPNRVCLVGSSYGGYAALWGVLRDPERYRCAASYAGVTDFDKMLKFDRRYLGRKAGKRWRERVTGDEDFDLDRVSPAEFADTLNRPTLVAHGTEDYIVPFDQFKRFTKAARKAPQPPETLVIDGEGHSFSKAENEQKWYDTLIAFLDKHNPAN